MQQLPGTGFFVAARLHADGLRELIDPVSNQDPLHRAVAEAELERNPHGTETFRAESQDPSLEATRQARRRASRPPTARDEAGQVGGGVPVPPPSQHLAGNAELVTQRRERNALFVQGHQFGSKRQVVSHASHASPPRDASYS